MAHRRAGSMARRRAGSMARRLGLSSIYRVPPSRPVEGSGGSLCLLVLSELRCSPCLRAPSCIASFLQLTVLEKPLSDVAVAAVTELIRLAPTGGNV